jgi:flavodoxin
MESREEKKLKALVIYYSATGNTGKVAGAIQDVLNENE